MGTVTNPLGNLINGLLTGHALGQQILQEKRAQEAFERQKALQDNEASVQDIMDQMKLEEMGARPVDNLGMVQDTVPAPSSVGGAPVPGVGPSPLPRSAAKGQTRTIKWRTGGSQTYEIPTDEELRQRVQAAQNAQITGQAMAQASAGEQVRKAFGIEPPQDLQNLYGGIPGYRMLPSEIPAARQQAAALRRGQLMAVGPGGAVVDTGPGGAVVGTGPGGAVVGTGQSTAPAAPGQSPAGPTPSGMPTLPGQPPAALAPPAGPTPGGAAATAAGRPGTVLFSNPGEPKGDFERTFLPAFALKHGLTAEGLKKNPDLTIQAVQEYAKKSKDPDAVNLAMQLGQARLDDLRARQTTTPMPINPGTREFRVAQDLAYGRMTMQQFRSLTAYSRDTNKKMDIYDKAGQLNPNFNPAAFEMGYTLAKNPKVQQQLASLDNVQQGVPDLLRFSNAAARSGVTVLNKAIIPGGIAFGGKHYSNFRTARTAFADELSGALGYGSATDMSREMGFDMTDGNLSPQNFASAIQDVVIPFVERKRSTMLNQMGVYGLPGMNPAAGPAPSAPQGKGGPATPPAGATLPRLTNKAERDKLPSGAHYIGPDGQEYVRQ